MKDFFLKLIAAITALAGAVSAVASTNWLEIKSEVNKYVPGVFYTNEIRIVEDFIYVHINFYKDRKAESAIDIHRGSEVFDSATYVEQVSIHKTKAPYHIKLQSSGIEPEILSINPSVSNITRKTDEKSRIEIDADVSVDNSDEAAFSNRTPNPKMIYVYRNGFQDGNSYCGKNVIYASDRITLVIDFSAIDWSKLIYGTPKLCIKRKNSEFATDVDVDSWKNGVAVADVFGLLPGDKFRVYWSWANSSGSLVSASTAENTQAVSCEAVIR